MIHPGHKVAGCTCPFTTEHLAAQLWHEGLDDLELAELVELATLCVQRWKTRWAAGSLRD